MVSKIKVNENRKMDMAEELLLRRKCFYHQRITTKPNNIPVNGESKCRVPTWKKGPF